MNDLMKDLLGLQSLDTELILLAALKRTRPQELEKERAMGIQAKQALDHLQQEIKRIKLECDRAELDLKKDQADLEKVQVALNTAKSNQEYQVLRDQIERLKERMGKAEEAILMKMAEIDSLNEEKKAAIDNLAAVEKEFKVKEEELQGFLKELAERANGLEKKRAEKAQIITPDALEVYSRILGRYCDAALAAVENNVCQGCHMSVTTQLITQLMIGRDLIQCKNCMRILYLPEREEG
ncbi:MAG: hypothetical protein HY717_12305 [Planctomycetes bacterium]|nr:hypothetical protein [Planctomycetota bacterium]